MTKQDYLVNSAKLLSIGTALLFFANLLVYLSPINDSLAQWGSKLSTFSFYLFLVIGFLAFNGEGIAYKLYREFKNKRVTKALKILLFSAFFIRYFKKIVEFLFLKVSESTLLGSFSRIFLGAFNTAASYGFLLFVVSLWYLKRDKAYKKLFVPEILAAILGAFYNIYKTLNYSVTKYHLTYFGEKFIDLFSNAMVLHILCLVQFLLDIIMFVFVIIHYNKLSLIETEKIEKAKKHLVYSRKIYNTDCLGLDTMEDDLLLMKPEEAENFTED